MDDKTLQSLIDALAVSPDNLPLTLTVFRESKQLHGIDQAIQHLSRVTPEIVTDVEDQLTIAEAYLEAGLPEKTKQFCTSNTPSTQLLLCKTELACGNPEQAKAHYQQAIQASSALQDKALETRLGMTGNEHQESRPKLKVIANDDTNVTELKRILAPVEKPVTFADVGGLAEVKKQINKKIILPYQKPSLFQRFRKRVGGGILLYGPPGCGKTLLARATAGECQANFFNVELADILDMYIGESEKRLHSIFEQARNQAPAVIFFDEVEAIGGKRQYSRESTSSKLVSQFLSELDGFAQNNHGVLVLASTNVPWAIDSAFLRPGRFDRLIFIPPPDQAARENILNILLKDRPTESNLNLSSLAKSTSGFSGADLQNLVETAIDNAIEDSITSQEDVPLNQQHLQQAMGEVKATTIDWLTSARNYAKYANESGLYNDVLSFMKKHGKY
ncbi:ATP-binding protein [Spartinivicinus poritis]|uniref:ATP-binding protein n=1 Tax=Spartinivicinus poritis TaxID=2994640 RepID=A0ABT5UC98_9GAMM|nr:ATP-binding protein [Spartinivicinus sp. A2-2]MDE1464004.1 ATP-binding protein [Spartinivicinus sp. A2-2]